MLYSSGPTGYWSGCPCRRESRPTADNLERGSKTLFRCSFSEYDPSGLRYLLQLQLVLGGSF